MSIFSQPHTLLCEESSIGAFRTLEQIQCEFVNLALGQLCPVSILFPTSSGKYNRIDTLRARDFDVCGHNKTVAECNDFCIQIARYLDRINYGEPKDCLTNCLSGKYTFIYDDNNNSEYLEFTCPISGLIKYAFPIKYRRYLICVVFIGQYRLCSESTDYGCCRTNKQFTSMSELRDYLARDILPEIDNFQRKVEENLYKGEREKLSVLAASSERKLSKQIKNVFMIKESQGEDYCSTVINNFWENVSEAYRPLFQSIDIRKSTIFINDDYCRESGGKIYGIDLYSVNEVILRKDRRVEAFDLSEATKIVQDQEGDYFLSTDSRIFSELDDCFLNLQDRDECDLHHDFIFYSDNSQSLTYSILVRRTQSSRSDIIVDLLCKIGSNIRFVLSSVLTKLSEYSTNSVLRIYRHEILHQVLALRTSINYLNAKDSCIVREKLNNIYSDCADCLSSLAFMTENIKIFTSTSQFSANSFSESCEYHTINVFADIINKHFAMHRELRESKNLWFNSTGRSEDSWEFRTQPRLLDLVIFNIISNAVKYAYPHTNIWFRYSILKEKYNTIRLAICDYGEKVPMSMDIYRLYYRGSSAEQVEDGSGIGLYVSKKIADVMAIRLYHTCKIVSQYNVPLMEKYLEFYHQFNDTEKRFAPRPGEIEQEIERLKKEKKYNSVINSDQVIYYEKNINEICQSISKPTYEVSFVIEI